MDQLSKSQYEIQFYNMSLNKINSIIKEEVQEIVLNNVDKMFTKFKDKLKNMDEKTNKKFLEERDNFKKIIRSKLQCPIEKFVSYLGESLQIPDNVLLPEDEISINCPDECEVKELESKISDLEIDILKLQYKIKEYSINSRKYDNLLEYVNELKAQISTSQVVKHDDIGSQLFPSIMNLKNKIETENCGKVQVEELDF